MRCKANVDADTLSPVADAKVNASSEILVAGNLSDNGADQENSKRTSSTNQAQVNSINLIDAVDIRDAQFEKFQKDICGNSTRVADIRVNQNNSKHVREDVRQRKSTPACEDGLHGLGREKRGIKHNVADGSSHTGNALDVRDRGIQECFKMVVNYLMEMVANRIKDLNNIDEDVVSTMAEGCNVLENLVKLTCSASASSEMVAVFLMYFA